MNSTMVREIRGAKINPKSSFKNRARKIRGGGNYASKYGMCICWSCYVNPNILSNARNGTN